MMNKAVPVHLWTYMGDRVLLVKCLNRDGTSYGGFRWPLTVGAQVKPDKCSPEPTCESGGLFGWPWGLHLGNGKVPDYAVPWVVFSAPPGQVVWCDGKVKVACADPQAVDARIEYVGSWRGALEYTGAGRVTWILQAAATGDYGSSAATGDRGYSAATGYRGASAATGDHGASAATGYFGSSAATGDHGASAATGYRGASAATGDHGASAATGYFGSSAATGDHGASAATGDHGASAATGYRGASAATGECGASVATGYHGSSAATGRCGVAAITGEHGTIEVGPHALGAVTSRRWKWIVRRGAVVCCRWCEGDRWPARLLDADQLGLADGVVVTVEAGEIIETTPLAM